MVIIIIIVGNIEYGNLYVRYALMSTTETGPDTGLQYLILILRPAQCVCGCGFSGAGPGERGQRSYRGEVQRETQREDSPSAHNGRYQRRTQQTGTAGQPLLRVQVGLVCFLFHYTGRVIEL